MTAPAPYFCTHCCVDHVGRVCVEVQHLTRVLPDLADAAAAIPAPPTDEQVRADVLAYVTANPGLSRDAIVDAVADDTFAIQRALHDLRHQRAVHRIRADDGLMGYFAGARPMKPPAPPKLIDLHGALMRETMRTKPQWRVMELAAALGLTYAAVDSVLQTMKGMGLAERSARSTRYGEGHAFRWSLTGKGRGGLA